MKGEKFPGLIESSANKPECAPEGVQVDIQESLADYQEITKQVEGPVRRPAPLTQRRFAASFRTGPD